MCECNALVFGFRDFDYTISFWSLGVLLNVKRMKIRNVKITFENNENKKI
jgi:hypothetical protein